MRVAAAPSPPVSRNLLAASTTDVPAAPARERLGTEARASFGPLSPTSTFYLGLVAVALAIGAVSLLIPSTPSYDPWSWLVWGREILHVRLHTTGGPTWKPLPVVFTTVFALFGKAQPDLWLVIARAGAVCAVVMAFRLSVRFTRQITAGLRRAESGLAGWLPALLAGGVAVLGIVFSGGYISDNALGYSEGLASAVVLIAIERHLDGRPRQAFAIGFVAALDRPEIWLFWGPYGLWVLWRDAGARPLVIALFALIPVLWFAPEYWGSGHFLRGVSRAQHVRSNSYALARCPFCSELKKAAWPTVLLRIKVAAAALVVAASAILGRRRLAGAGSQPWSRALGLAALFGVVGAAWWVLIAVLTQAGFSGNNRYLVIGSALVDICGGVAWAGAAAVVGSALARATGRRAGALVGVAALTLVFLLLPPDPVRQDVGLIPRTHRALVYQAHLRDGVTDLVRRYGAGRLLSCGSIMTEGFQVPMVAWTLDVHTVRVLGPPSAGAGPPPNVILQTRASRNLGLLPIVHTWPAVHYRYVGHSGPFRLFTHCS